MSDDAAIHRLLEERLEATRSKDSEASVGYYTDDVVTFDIAPPLALVGGEATDPSGPQAWFDTWEGRLGLDLRDVRIHVHGDMALAYGLLHMHGERTDGTHTDAWTRLTVGLERRDGEWKIIHEHGSFPMKMDGSGKVADDLQP